MTATTHETRVYTLSTEGTRDWIADVDGDGCAFKRLELSTSEPPGTRIEVYAADHRLLEAFTVS